jgi:AhpD family alkylhydroperoxidase
MKHNFDRRIYNFSLLCKDIAYLLIHIPSIIGLLRDIKINKAFIEKIMLVVTAVNSCPYCAWFHSKKAIQSGLSKKEINAILTLQFSAQPDDYETLALLYAQHFAETNRNPDELMNKKLYEYYGNKTARHIITAIQLIYFGNLSGNTFDAFLSRLKGNPAHKSNVIFEFLFFLLSAPILLPTLPYTTPYRKKS